MNGICGVLIFADTTPPGAAGVMQITTREPQQKTPSRQMILSPRRCIRVFCVER